MESLIGFDSNFFSIAVSHDIDIGLATCVLVNESQL